MTLVVGHPPHKEERGALHLAASLARAAGQDLRLVSVVPPAWPVPVPEAPDPELERWSLEYAAQAAAGATAALLEHCPDLRASTATRVGSSVAAELMEECDEAGAGMVVVGSGSGGPWGHVVLGTAATHLLHAAPVPVAVAPRGYRTEPGGRVFRVTCAFRGDEASRDVLDRAARVCFGLGAELRVVTFAVRGRTMYPPELHGDSDALTAYVTHTAGLQDKAAADLSLPTAGGVETAVAVGRTWADALEQVDWHGHDLLLVGSSVASVGSRLFLGSDATRIVRHSPVPVVVVA